MELFNWILGVLRDPGELVRLGYPVLWLVVFAETGALIAFLPGDSLLFIAGLYCAKGHLNLFLLNGLLISAAIIGDATSYQIGKHVGARLFARKESRIFKPEHLESAQAFYDRHGGKAIILARFVPLVRTFVPVIAGVAGMPYRKFAMFNIVGAIAWVVSMTVLGYFLGQIDWVSKNLEKVIILIVFISIVPMISEYVKAWREKKKSA